MPVLMPQSGPASLLLSRSPRPGSGVLGRKRKQRAQAHLDEARTLRAEASEARQEQQDKLDSELPLHATLDRFSQENNLGALVRDVVAGER